MIASQARESHTWCPRGLLGRRERMAEGSTAMKRFARAVSFGFLLCVVTVTTGAGESPPQAVIDVANSSLSDLGTDPVIVEAVHDENFQRKTLDQIQMLDEGWRAAQGTPEFMRGWLDSECGRRLREIKSSSPFITILWVTDEQGANVAMSDKVAAYWHGEESCFVGAYRRGTGDVYVGEVESEPTTGRSVAQVCVPVMRYGDAIGVIHMVVDIDGL